MPQRKQIQTISLIGLLAIMLILMGMIFLPYADVLLWAAVCYILIDPLYSRILKKMNPKKRFYEAKRHLLAGTFAVLTVLLLIGIFFFIGFKLIGQIRVFIDQVKQFILENPHFFQDEDLGVNIAEKARELSLGAIDLSSFDLKAEALSFLNSYAEKIMSTAGNLIKNISGFVVSLVFVCFSLYFFYVDGKALARIFINAIPIDKNDTQRLLSKFRDVTKNLFRGFFLVAFYQGVAALIIYSLFRVQGPCCFQS
ncbi:AI-2E family transporter [Brucepastera parasyntrophica]|uniref:AI-2E family transporter n=1 Tax=Brucepastera parasyntrophica TaxID=2880008 RepID=UPI00210C0F24|nr:AI-2E family transporter [Brucepastera parasyntrophica]